MVEAVDVVRFWREAGSGKWFSAEREFDRTCRERFLDAHMAAARRELEHWLDTAQGGLALVLLLDQIPRNVFRGSAHAYATDPLARHYADRMLGSGQDKEIDSALRTFVYMPYEHSEDPADQDRAVALIGALGNASYDHYAIAHRDVIARFGRFPHRNHALGRENTPEEQAWLDAGGGF